MSKNNGIATWQEISAPDVVAGWKQEFGDEVPPPKVMAHRDGRLAMVGYEPTPSGDLRWHISLRISDESLPGGGRIPNWRELVTTAHELRPGVVFVIAVPPKSWWMNVHPHVLHLWETHDNHLIEGWRMEAMGHTPT